MNDPLPKLSLVLKAVSEFGNLVPFRKAALAACFSFFAALLYDYAQTVGVRGLNFFFRF